MDTEHEQLLELGDQPTAMPVRQNLLDVKLCLACYGKRFNEAGTRSKIDTARRRKAAKPKNFVAFFLTIQICCAHATDN